MSDAASGAPERLPQPAVAALLVALAGATALVRARSYDLWWHLETGREILRTSSIPRADPFSFTSAGAAWVDHEWLFQILLYLIYVAVGPLGFTVLKAVCAGATAVIGYTSLRRSGAKVGVALGVVSLAALGLRFRLAERPETISLPMAAATALLLLSLIDRPERPTSRLLAVSALSAVWCNLHAGALLAPAMGGAMAAGSLMDLMRAPREQRVGMRVGALTALGAAGLSAACLLVNPFGARIYLVPSGIAEALRPGNLVNPEWVAPSWNDSPLFFLAAGAVAIAAGISLAKRRPLSGARAALLLLAVAMGFTSVRHVGVFFALLPLMIDASWKRDPLPAGVALCLGVTTWMLFVPPPGAQVGLGLAEGRFPHKAADFIDSRLADARLYNDVSFGGYLIWRGYPRRRVFIDGRNEVHAALLQDLSEALDDGRKWRALLDRHGVQGAVLAYRDGPVAVRDAVTGAVRNSTFSELHFPRREWALVYWDDLAMVFVSRSGPYRDLAGQLEYRNSRPEAWRQDLQERGIVDAEPGVAEEIRRKLAEDAGCRLAKQLAALYGIR